MKKLSILAAAAALAAATAAPVAAETKNDPFVSTQGSLAVGGAGAAALAAVVIAIVVAASTVPDHLAGLGPGDQSNKKRQSMAAVFFVEAPNSPVYRNICIVR